MVSENVASWVCLNTLLGASRVGIFVSVPVSWSIFGGWGEASIEVIRFRTIASAIHSINIEYWNYTL